MSTVEFPKLGISFNINNVAFEIFGMEIYWYGIIIAAGFMLAVLLAMRDAPKHGIKQDNVLDAILFAAPVGIVCARIFYVIFNWQEFGWDRPLDIINTRKGGLAIYGGIIGAFVTAYLYARVKKIGVFKLFDFCIVYIPLAHAIGRWGNFMNQEAYGYHTDLPWGMDGSKIADGPVHPTFLYEFLWNLATFFFLLWARKRKKKDGEIFFLYMAIYGLGRSWIEGLRTDSLMLGNLRVNQVLAIIFFLVFIVLFIVWRIKASQQEVQAGAVTSSYASVLEELREEDEGEETADPPIEEAADPAVEEAAEEAEADDLTGGDSAEDVDEDEDVTDE